MLVEEEDQIEKLMQVGMMVVIHTDPEYHTERRYRSFVRGWHCPFHIVIDRPQSANRPAPLREDQPCVIRFAVEGRACAFDTHILDWENKHEAAYCRVAWPEKVEVASFRKHQRIPVMIPCTIDLHTGQRIKGEIQDLSIGGCRVRAESQVEEGFDVKLGFSLPDGSTLKDVVTIVRSVHPIDDECVLGCQFEEGQESVNDGISFCIATMLDHERIHGNKRSTDHILIIDNNPESNKALRQVLEGEKWNVFTASNTLDGLMRLRLLPPAALIVNQNQGDLSGTDITRLVKSSRGYEFLPVFILGSADATTKEEAIQAGAMAFFTEPYDMKDMCNQVIASAKKAIHSAELQTPQS